jgi:hypothetical protein
LSDLFAAAAVLHLGQTCAGDRNTRSHDFGQGLGGVGGLGGGGGRGGDILCGGQEGIGDVALLGDTQRSSWQPVPLPPDPGMLQDPGLQTGDVLQLPRLPAI